MSTPSPNPSLLKLNLAMHGVQLDGSLPSDLRQVPWPPESVAPSIELVLPEEVLIRVPIEESFTRASPYRLVSADQRLWIANNGERSEVRLIPQPAYYAKTTVSGTPMWRIGTVSGGHVAINPGVACGSTRLGTPCRFCDIAARAGHRSAALSVADVVETVGEAFAEGAVELVYLHVGALDGDDAGVAFLEPYVHAIKKHFDTLVAVQLQPPADNRWIDRTYAMGVDALSYSVEIHDPALLQQYCGSRAQRIERERYYEALRYAAAIFPSGTVWSDLIVGLEPPASTMAGIDALVGMGVLPVLSLSRPTEDHPLHHGALPVPDEVAPVFAHLFSAVRNAKINMNWVRDLSSAVTPLDARFFSSDGAALSVSGQFYRSRIGGLAARNLSRMRRRLRVRKVSDSFDSSQL
jgi:hypothetical protein